MASHRKRLVVLISGNGSNLQAVIDACADDRINGDVVCVVSNKASAYGLTRARRAQIPAEVFPYAPYRDLPDPRARYDAELAERVAKHAPDIIVLAGFMRVLSRSFLDRFPEQIINLHPALPGQFIGLNAIERAWTAKAETGLSETGVMVHGVTEDVDVGPIHGTATVSMVEHDSLESLSEAMHAAEHFLLVQVLTELTHAR